MNKGILHIAWFKYPDMIFGKHNVMTAKREPSI